MQSEEGLETVPRGASPALVEGEGGGRGDCRTSASCQGHKIAIAEGPRGGMPAARLTL